MISYDVCLSSSVLDPFMFSLSIGLWMGQSTKYGSFFFLLFLFADASFPKCHFHLPSRLIMDVVFSQHPTPAPPCPGMRTQCDAVGLISGNRNRCAWSNGCTSSDRPHAPPPFGCRYLSASWKERSAQAVSSCSLCTPCLCESKPWGLASPHCLPLKPSLSAPPECLRCADVLPETGACFWGRELCP